VVAVSVYYAMCDVSRIVFIDMMSGKPIENEQGTLVEHIDGVVCSIGQSERAGSVSNWQEEEDDDDDNDESKPENYRKNASPIGLYALTSEGLLVAFKEECDTAPQLAESNVAIIGTTSSNVPRLPTALGSRDEPARKRIRIGYEKSMSRVEDRKLSMTHFGSILGNNENAVPLPTAELPVLSGGFARAFVGRSLLRRANN
jgi:hypothetical protein